MKSFRKFLEDKEYTAIVRDPSTKGAHKITATSRSLKQFKSDLRSNGYRVMNAAPADTFGSPEWERKLYTDKENRKNRKFNRLQKQVNKNNFVRERTKSEEAAYDQLFKKWSALPSLSPEKIALNDKVNAAYERLMKARERASEQFEKQ